MLHPTLHHTLPLPAAQYLVKNGGVDSEEDYAYWGYGLFCQRRKEADRWGGVQGLAAPGVSAAACGQESRPAWCPASHTSVRNSASRSSSRPTHRHVVTIDGYEDVPPNDAESLQKALAHQPVAVAICASPAMQVRRWCGCRVVAAGGGDGVSNGAAWLAKHGWCSSVCQPTSPVALAACRPQFYSSGVIGDDQCCQELNHGVLAVSWGGPACVGGPAGRLGGCCCAIAALQHLLHKQLIGPSSRP